MSFDPSQPPAEPFQPSPEPGSLSSDERMWAMLCHLGGLGWYVAPMIGNIVGALIFWMIKKDTMPFVDDQGKEALNFQISITIYTAVSLVLIVAIIGIFLAIAVGIFSLVMLIIAAVKANQGVAYRYPLCIRFIK